MKGVEIKLWLTRDEEGLSVYEGNKPTSNGSWRGCKFILGIDPEFFKKEFGFLPDMNSCDRCELIIKRKDRK